jgi:hypothetical protein
MNGRRWLPGLDCRTAKGRRYRDLLLAYKARFSHELSELELALIR